MSKDKMTVQEEIDSLVTYTQFMNDNFAYSSSIALNCDTRMNQSLRTGTRYSLEGFDCF